MRADCTGRSRLSGRPRNPGVRALRCGRSRSQAGDIEQPDRRPFRQARPRLRRRERWVPLPLRARPVLATLGASKSAGRLSLATMTSRPPPAAWWRLYEPVCIGRGFITPLQQQMQASGTFPAPVGDSRGTTGPWRNQPPGSYRTASRTWGRWRRRSRASAPFAHVPSRAFPSA
jgi:hypothetical protein